MAIKEINNETSYVTDAVSPHLSKKEVPLLYEKYKNSARRRHRLCFHQNPTVDLHDIIICYDEFSYIPPNKHVGKVESLIVLSGELDFFLFNDNGQVYDYRRLSTIQSGNPFYVRVPSNTWHGLRSVGKVPCIIKETISGPYDRSTLKWAHFAPAETEGLGIGSKWYDDVKATCESSNVVPPQDEVFEVVDEGLFRSSRQLVTVSFSQLAPIVQAAKESPLLRARLCCHDGPQEKLQEMFIALAKGVDIEESVHLRKDESLTIIDGAGSYLFPNEDGSIRKTIFLGAYDDGSSENDSAFFARINRYVSHKINIDTDFLLIHEATTGPFSKADTAYRLRGAKA